MCDCQPTRRDLLIGAALAAPALWALAGSASPSAAATTSVDAAVPAVEVLPGLSIFPRDAWGADLPPKHAIASETPKFLLVHHTASSNLYHSARNTMRNTYFWHTSSDPTKGWPDVAYEFFVGKEGDVWEGRAGALAGPVRADATGGSQGFAQLVCLMGTFETVLPTAAAQEALVKVLAWQADRFQIDTSPGATTSFVSRGSQLWPAGTPVTTRTIAGHREMSETTCPGNAFFPQIAGLPALVQAQRAAWASVTKPAVRLGRVSP